MKHEGRGMPSFTARTLASESETTGAAFDAKERRANWGQKGGERGREEMQLFHGGGRALVDVHEYDALNNDKRGRGRVNRG